MSAETQTFANARLKWRVWPRRDDAAGPIALRGFAGGAERLRSALVVVFGLGAVGGTVFSALARAGVGTLIGIDPDRYGEASFWTQPCDVNDAGAEKSRVQGERAHAAQPGCAIATATGMAQDAPYWLIRRADALVVAGDNLELLVWATRMAHAFGKRVVQGAVDPETWSAFVRSHDMRDGANACGVCMVSRSQWRSMRSRHGCDPSLMVKQGREATRALPHLCATAGALVAGEVVKLLAGREGQALLGEEVAYCLFTHRIWRSPTPRNPQCALDHERWECRDIERAPEQVSLRELIESVCGGASQGHVRGELPWISEAVCPRCSRVSPARRFARIGAPAGWCLCGEELAAEPFGAHSMLPSRDLEIVADASIGELGVPPRGSIGVLRGDQWAQCFIGGNGEDELSALERTELQ